MATKKPSLKIQTPVGDFNWMFTSGEGRENDNGAFRYSGDVYFEEETPKVKAFIEKALAFWEEHKPKGARKAKSIGVYYEVKIPDDESPDGFKLSRTSYTGPLDEDMEKTGRIIISAWTGTTLPDGKTKKVKTYIAKGAEVDLGEKGIGKGSRGAISGALGIYDNGSNKGVTFYLNGLVITKFVEYVGSDYVEAVEDEDGDGFDGSELNEVGATPVSDDDDQPKAKVEL